MALLHSWTKHRPTLWISLKWPYEPEKGMRFNAAKLVIDPYAKAVAEKWIGNYPIFNYSGRSAGQISRNVSRRLKGNAEGRCHGLALRLARRPASPKSPSMNPLSTKFMSKVLQN